MERSTVHTLLHDLAESAAPPSTVDIERATTTGRRTIRIRRMLVAGSAAIAVAAVAGILGVMVSGGTNAAPQPAPFGTQSRTPPPPDQRMPEQAPASFDPMVQYAQTGWVPDGSVEHGVMVARDWLAATATYQPPPTAPENSAPGEVVLYVAGSGRGIDPMRFGNHAVAPDAMPVGTPADPVNGRTAEWTDGYGTTLRWEYAPGTWAAVVVRNLIGVDNREVARRVATGVRFAVDLPIRMPYTAAIPPSLPLAMIQVSQHSGGWFIQADYGTERTQYGDWPLTIIAAFPSAAEPGDGSVIGDPNTTLDGHPARTNTGLDGGSGLRVFNVNGVYLEMLTHSPQATAQLSGGLEALFRSMDVNPDPAQWG